jgi:hypothetical protein
MSAKPTPTVAPAIVSKPKVAGTVSAAEDVPMSKANADASSGRDARLALAHLGCAAFMRLSRATSRPARAGRRDGPGRNWQ